MSSIPFAVRLGARYHFRRRLHLRNVISRPVGLSLQTSDPAEARVRSALLSARFAVVKRRLTALFSKHRDFLTGAEIAALMRAELENELARAIAPSFDDCDHVSAIAYSSRFVAEAYAIAGRPDRPKTILPDDEAMLLAKGLDGLHIEAIRQDLEETCQEELSDEDVKLRLAAVGAPVNPATLERARGIMMRGRSEAYHRATRMLDPRVVSSADPVATLMEPEFAPEGAPVPATAQATPVPAVVPQDCQFLIYDSRRFSEIIDGVVAELKDDGTWSGDTKDQRRIAMTFAWITGNKELGSYTHLDVDVFKKGLEALPNTFFFGTFEKGAMSRPFAEVVATVPKPTGLQRRNPKTVNRDLSFMSTIAKTLAKTAWRPKIPNTKVLDFSGATVTIKDRGKDTRPPWRRPHMELLFSSPIYTGGGPPLMRLRVTSGPTTSSRRGRMMGASSVS